MQRNALRASAMFSIAVAMGVDAVVALLAAKLYDKKAWDLCRQCRLGRFEQADLDKK